MSRVIHFEVPSSDMAASQKFYENVFGWKLTRWEGPMEYMMVTTGEQGTPGINGAIGGAANEFHATVNTVDVDDLDTSVQKVVANGGTVILPREPIPGVGYLAYVREPGGAVFGLMQDDPKAGM